MADTSDGHVECGRPIISKYPGSCPFSPGAPWMVM